MENPVRIYEDRGMKLFKNKFFIIVLSIAIFAIIFTSVLSLMGKTGPVKNALNVISTPFRYIGSSIKEGFEGFSEYFASVKALENENRELREEIERLEGELADSVAAKEENKRLKNYLSVKDSYSHLTLLEGLIIGREGDNHTTFITLNKGIWDGVDLGMAIITENGLVGSVVEVGYNWCRVRVLSEASASVGAYVVRSGEIGLAQGDISLKGTGRCYLKYLSPDADVKIGDTVYTSGKGSVYPEGLLIGHIADVKTNEYLRTKTAEIDLAVDFEELKYVMIVIAHTRSADNTQGE